MNAAPAKRRLQLATVVIVGAFVLVAVVALASGSTGAATAFGFGALAVFWITVATHVLPLRHRRPADSEGR